MIAVLVKYQNEKPKVVWVKDVTDVNNQYKVLEDVKVLMEKGDQIEKKSCTLNNFNIYIHWDFTDGNELSYRDGRIKSNIGGFHTHCLEFFTTGSIPRIDDVIVINNDGEYISRNELLQNDGTYTSKEIRPAHDLRKMLVAGSFRWKKK